VSTRPERPRAEPESQLRGPETTVTPLADIIDEAWRILSLAAESRLPLRLIGGLAIRVHTAGPPRPSLAREFKDIDLVTRRESTRDVFQFITSLGYKPDHGFNTLNAKRALFYDVQHQRRLDIFIGTFEMCHKVPIADRLDVDPATVPLAELLVTKLQIIQLNDKDLRDIFALLLDHEVADHDADTVNGAYIAKLCANDWGLWRTCKLNVERARLAIEDTDLSEADRRLLTERLEALWRHIEGAPKSRRWKLRNRVGDRVRWYVEPEEVE